MSPPVTDSNDWRAAEIARLDATSRTRALDDRESRRLERLLYNQRYASHRDIKRRAA